MKKNDLKKLIKPIVKECINEVLIEEGLLSNIVSEVAIGMQGNQIVENKPATAKEEIRHQNTKNKEAKLKLEQHRKKMMEAVGSDAYNGVNLFEGTTPAPAQQEAAGGSVDLGNPTDAGVDISSLMGGASQIWKAMK